MVSVYCNRSRWRCPQGSRLVHGPMSLPVKLEPNSFTTDVNARLRQQNPAVHTYVALCEHYESHSALFAPSTGEGLSQYGFVSDILSTGAKCFNVPWPPLDSIMIESNSASVIPISASG